MMSDPQTQNEIIQRLETISRGVTDYLRQLSDVQFTAGTDTEWSAESYLKHLLLSIKPLAKAIHFPAEQLQSMFGLSEHPSRSYSETVAAYKKRLEEGIRAEDFSPVTPMIYRFPDGVNDTRGYLLQSWEESNAKLIDGTARRSEAELDELRAEGVL